MTGDSSLRYHLAHAQYRRGLLSGARNGHEAESAFSDCIDQLKPLLSRDPKSVEPLILQSACYSGLADHRTLESVLLRSRSDERLKCRAQIGAAQSARRFSCQPGGPAPGEARHPPTATGLRAAAARRTIVRRDLGDQHRCSGLGTCRGIPGARPGTAGARRSTGRPQLDREILDCRTRLTRRRNARWRCWCGPTRRTRAKSAPQPGMIRRDEATRHAVIAVRDS